MSGAYPYQDAIVITGVGAVCTLGNSVREIWDRLLSAKPGFSPVGVSDTDGFGIVTLRASRIPDVKTDIPPQLAKSMGMHLSLLLKSAEEAYDSSGLRPGEPPPEEIGFFAGMGMVDYHIEDLLPAVLKSLGPEGNLDYAKFFSRGYQEIYPLWSLGMLNNVVFCQAAIHFGIRGENCVFSPHGDSGILAVAEGVKILRERKAKAVLAGGISEDISPLGQARARLAGLIDSGCTDSSGNPLAFILGECGAMLVIEPLDGAESRGAKPLARLMGFGFSCERDNTNVVPPSHAVASAMEAALSQARMKPEDIDLIMVGNAECGRPNEWEAVRSVFGMGENKPILISSDRVVGEVFAASPIVNAIIGVKILESEFVPRCLLCCGLESDGSTDPALFQLKGGSGLGRILINTMSYEGQCASMIIERF